MFLAINRYVFLSMLIASLVHVAWLVPSSSEQTYVRRRAGFLPRRRSRDKSSWKGQKKKGK